MRLTAAMRILQCFRTALLTACLCLAAGADAEVVNLPDIGSPSDGLLSVRTEAMLGRQVYANLISTGTVITDPELKEYIQDLGMRLVAHAEIKQGQRFNFFLIDSSVINAFALPGGYIGIHTGLLLATKNESELAGVLAHEISHVTQRHISRAVFANQRASTLSLATMLGAILVGMAAGGNADAIAGAVSITQGMAIEEQISFTRSNEYEADRVAVPVTANAGFDPMAMPDFFETMARKSGSLTNRAPEFLLTHPISSDRMAETRARAHKYPPVQLEDSLDYRLARARTRMLVSSRPEKAMSHFQSERNALSGYDSAISRVELDYGTALALNELGGQVRAETILHELVTTYEESIPLHSEYADTLVLLGQREKALASYEAALVLFPRNLPLTVRYAKALLHYDEPKQAHTILLDLLNQVPPTLEQVRLIAVAANSAGDVADAYYYMAEYQAMSGNLKLAMDQLILALGTPGLDSVQKARFTARLDEFSEYLAK